MTTHEENLKKINEEFEKLDDKELEKVAGGFTYDEYKKYLDKKKNPREYVAISFGN